MTCKVCLDPGLDEVWREIESFKPLIACLPEDIWMEQKIIVPSNWPEEEEEEEEEEYTMLVSALWLKL